MRKKYSLIPYKVIALATIGDVIAMDCVVKHFNGFLNQLSRKTFFDRRGNTYIGIDPDIKRHLVSKLMLSVLKFRVNR